MRHKEETTIASPLDRLTTENRIMLQTAVEAIDMLVEFAAANSGSYGYDPNKLYKKLKVQMLQIGHVFGRDDPPPPFSEVIAAVTCSINDGKYYEQGITQSIKQSRAELYGPDDEDFP